MLPRELPAQDDQGLLVPALVMRRSGVHIPEAAPRHAGSLARVLERSERELLVRDKDPAVRCALAERDNCAGSVTLDRAKVCAST